MNQKKSAKASLLKYSLIVPLALALVVSSNAQTVINKAKKALTTTTTKEVKATEKKTPIAPAKSTATVTDPVKVVENGETEKTWDVVEKMPQYPGGDKEMLGHLSRNLRYPVVAQQNNIQGKVIASFVVSSTGKVINPEILRSVDPSLDKEALRVISTFPDFIPGEQNDKKVAVRYTIPVVFILEGSITPTPALAPNEKPIVVVGYGKQTPGSTPNVKEFDPSKPPVFVVDGKIQPKNFNVKTIDANTIESISVNKSDKEEVKARLVAKYGEDAANGVVKITLKD
jgi:TonB family protein